jgi:uncharacterized protein (TIGR02145 family)
MKKFITINTLLFSVFAFSQIGIGTATPASSAQLDVSSTTRGLLPPRMTNAQKNDIADPVAGLMLWCTDCGTNGEMQVYNGTVWTYAKETECAVPGTPKNVVATANPTSVTITFTAPESGGICNITGYTVTSNPPGFNASGTSSPITVTGLNNVTFYTFTVVANNAVGISAPSAPCVPRCGAITTSGQFLEFMCHNLGADTTKDPFKNDLGAINGDLYQWGRKTDNHQVRNSVSVITQATNNDATLPLNVKGRFIYNFSNWRNATINTLWGDGTTGANPAKGVNDPCPSGYKVPSDAQWRSIINTNATISGLPSLATANVWTWTYKGFRVGTSLFLPAAGYRYYNNGYYSDDAYNEGAYFSCTINGTYVKSLYFYPASLQIVLEEDRAYGESIRCVKQ